MTTFPLALYVDVFRGFSSLCFVRHEKEGYKTHKNVFHLIYCKINFPLCHSKSALSQITITVRMRNFVVLKGAPQ